MLANVADVKSLVINPAGTTHSQMTDKELEACGIAPTTIRLSIGTEHIDDIIADLENGDQASAGRKIISECDPTLDKVIENINSFQKILQG